MTTIVVEKNLITQQDIAYGENSFTQVRGGGTFPVDQVRCIYPVNSLAELNSLDPVKFPKVILFTGNNFYLYTYVGGNWVEQKTKNIDSWASIATVLPTAAGQLFSLAQHTSPGIGGGTLMSFAGTATDNGGTQKDALGGYYLKRINYDKLKPEMFGYAKIVDMPNATLLAYLDAGGAVQDVIGVAPNFVEQILLGQRDVSMLVMSDSTANETDEWVYVTAQALAAKFPTHSVVYYLWNTTSYNAPVNISTGSGSKKIYINNGAIPGATAAYFLGSNRPAVYNSMTADLVILSYGHNMGTAANYNQVFNFHVTAFSEIIADNPTAETVVTIQNIDTQFPVYSGIQAQAIHDIASILGCGVIDVREIFTEKYVQGGIANWLRPADPIHPNAVGERVWSNIVFNALINTAKKPSVPRNILADSEQNLVYNDMFYLWLWSDTLPSGYTINAYCTASSDKVNFETKGYSVKLTSTGTVGQIGILSNDFGGTLPKFNKANGATFSARVKPSAASGNNCGRVEVDLGGGVVVSSWPRTEPKNGWYWSSVYLTSAQLIAATKCILSVYSGETTDTVSIDRITLNEGNLLKNSRFKPIVTKQFYKPTNVLPKTVNDILVITGNQVQATNTIDAYPGFKINITDLEIGTSYTATWTSAIAAANSAVLVRSYGGGGAVQATATPLNTNTITWVAIADSASLQVEILAASAGTTTFTVTNLSIMKT